jgi:hypothetical protein
LVAVAVLGIGAAIVVVGGVVVPGVVARGIWRGGMALVITLIALGVAPVTGDGRVGKGLIAHVEC